MSYWTDGIVLTLLVLAALLVAAEALRAALPPLARLGIPGSIVAGCLGLAFGPDLVGWLPLDRPVLESVVYHGLAVVFIAVGLQHPEEKGAAGPGARSYTFGVPFFQSVQVVLGLGVILVLGLFSTETLHPGVGLMLPLGFEQGPGQALSLGAAWEKGGMTDGAQVGLIVAALGFAWAVVVGIPLVIWGRMRGLITPARPIEDPDHASVHASTLLPPGSLDLLTRQAVAIAGCYLVTWAICLGLTTALASLPDIADAIWGFHFVIGGFVAMLVRPLLDRAPTGTPLDDLLLARASGMAVDVMTCGALAAVQIGVLRANAFPLLLVTSVGGVVTLIGCLWLGSRAFPNAPFEHAVVWFGMSTGTLPMGLALLRIIDPDLRSPAPLSAVVGSAGSVIPSIPMLLILIPTTAASWPESWPGSGWVALGIAATYAVIMLLLWRFLGPLRFTGPLWRLWLRPEASR